MHYFVLLIKILINLYPCISIFHIAKNYKQCCQAAEISELNDSSGTHVA
jgi:hypothetical protein